MCKTATEPLEQITSVEAAKAFLNVGRGANVDALKMQKLVYIAHENHIAETSMPFISDRVEAWKDGPVFPLLAKIIGNREKRTVNADDLPSTEIPEILKKQVESYLKLIWDHHKDDSGQWLSGITHQKGTPWYVARNPKERSFLQRLIGWKPKHPRIEDDMIRHYCLEMGVWRS